MLAAIHGAVGAGVPGAPKGGLEDEGLGLAGWAEEGFVVAHEAIVPRLSGGSCHTEVNCLLFDGVRRHDPRVPRPHGESPEAAETVDAFHELDGPGDGH